MCNKCMQKFFSRSPRSYFLEDIPVKLVVQKPVLAGVKNKFKTACTYILQSDNLYSLCSCASWLSSQVGNSKDRFILQEDIY